MKTEDFKNNNTGQGQPTSDRAQNNNQANLKSQGVSNGGSQRSDQTSSRDGAHQPQKKK